ncbi:MAG: TonB-dependent receptor [Prolixibacteraceae bacterium]|jgi:TonB-linked SusC/RagA family outer membrane protein|nr:TonB-dependent receptor [Prolixibacteraceae bacterium]
MKKKRFLKVVGLIVPLLLLSIWSFGQPKTVQGTVKDITGNPIPGVTVMVKGTTQGTLTGSDGSYALKDANSDGVLIFSFVGMKTTEVAINGRSQISVNLAEEVSDIDEVVVVGYGTQRKEAVTGSVSSMKGDVMREVPSSNITQALQGRVAGVDMSQTSSKPGATMQIRIRGTRSLSASNDPLVVLDGIPFSGSISDLSTDDIKSIDILKDASATAIYGSRGANGVILVTTNKGQKGKKAQVSYNNYYGVKDAIKYPMMNAEEFKTLRTYANKFTNGVDEADDINIDWQDLYYRQGVVTNHDVNVVGGTDRSNYKFGIGYNRDEAVMYGQDYSRYSLRGSLDQEIGRYFRFGFTTNNNYSINMGNNLGLYGVLSMSPIANPYNADGTMKRIVKMPLDDQFVYTREIIEGLGDQWIDQSKAFGSYNSMYGEMVIPGVEGLKFRTNLGADFRMTNGGSYTGEGVFATNATTPSSASISNSLNTHWAVENLLTFDRTFAEKHQVNAVAMYSAEQTQYNRSQVSATDIPSDALQFYNLGQAPGDKVTINPDNQDYQESGLLSWMGRVMYSYDNKYMLSATLRSDASSRLAPGYQWHSYPAVSVGWNIKNESFMEDVTDIDMLKFRAGYGQTSNQSVAPYATLGRLATRPYNFGDTYSTGYFVSQLPNPNLGWEYSETMNVGFDFALLKNRLSGTIEYYQTKTKDILLGLGLPATSGVSGYTANIGETENKGWELSLNGVILDNANGFSWDAGINMYGNKNELTALASGQEKDENNWWFVGHSLNVVYDYEKIGLWNETDADYKYLQTLVPGGNAGMIKVKYTGEYNEDGSPKRAIGTADRQIIDLDPKIMGGFNTRIAYKGFDLSAVGAFRFGGKLISTLYSSAGYLNMLSGRRGNVQVDYWTPENTDAKYPKPGGITDGDNPKYGSTLGLFDASYVKIRTITLGYNFNQKLIKSIGIEKLRVYGTVQNPFVLFSPYHSETGMDPETNSYGNENAAVAYSSNLRRLLTIGTNTPSTRNYMIGINLTF